MSHIRFDTKHATTYLSGAERRHMNAVCTGITYTVLRERDDLFGHPSWTRSLLPDGHYLHKWESKQYDDNFEIWFKAGAREMVHPVTKEPVDQFDVILNTALLLGSDEVKLMARLHGQCEVHAYVPPEEAGFIVKLIESGRASGLYRANMGWEGVADFLRKAEKDKQDVVTSYSVTDTFPGWDVERDTVKDWDTEMDSLRLRPLMALREEHWRKGFLFSEGLTVFSLREAAGA